MALDGVLIRRDFWTFGQCDKVRTAMDAGDFSAAEIYADGFVVDELVRKSYEVEVKTELLAEVETSFRDAQAEVSRFFRVPIVGAEGPGFLRYPVGGFYRAHRDCLADTDDAFPRKVSIVLFLTSATTNGRPGGCEGGTLRLYRRDDRADVPIDIAPAAGTLVAFPSTLLHEVMPVTAGVRDAIVDWFY